MVYSIRKKVCMVEDCDNSCLKNNNICYFHCNVLNNNFSMKKKQLYEIINIPEHQKEINLLKDFEYISGYDFYKKWLTDDTYTFNYKKIY